MKKIAILLILLVIGTPAVAQYKIEMVNGDSITVKWYKLDKEKEVVVYQKKGKVSQLPAADVANIVRIDPPPPKEEPGEESSEIGLGPHTIKVEIVPSNPNPNPEQDIRTRQAIQDAQRQNDEWRARQILKQMQRKKEYEKNRKEYERKNTEYAEKNCNRRKQDAKTDMERYAARLERAKDYYSEIRREPYSSSTASSHKKSVQRAKDKVENLERQYNAAKEKANETCP